MEVRFEIVKLSETVYEKLADGKSLSAFFDKTRLRDVRIAPRVGTGATSFDGLVEAYGLKGRWSIGIACSGDIEETWRGFTAGANAYIDPEATGLLIVIDGGGLAAEAVLDAVGKLTELLDVSGGAVAVLDAGAGAPVELYYRPPIGYYDDFALSAMDGDTLSQLERRLIE